MNNWPEIAVSTLGMPQNLVADVADTVQINADPSDFLDAVRQFVSEEILPNTRAWEAEMAFPDDVWPKLGRIGLLGMTIPEPFGGRNDSCQTYADAILELAKGDPALAMNVAAWNALSAAHIVTFGDDAQKARYLPGICRGDIRLAWALTEPEAGSDARRVQTVAEPAADGTYRLHGEKMFITNGGKATLLVVIARTGPKELSAFLMEATTPGFRVTERIETVGVKASNTVRFLLEGAVAEHTPCTFDEAISLLHRGRIGIAAMALGIAEKAFELAVAHVKSREQFGRKLGDMQSVQNFIADSALEIQAGRFLIEKAAAAYDAGQDCTTLAAMAKLHCSETANRVTNRAIQVHGGRGMVPEYLVEKLWRDAKLTEIGEGCSEIQRLIIAKRYLR